MEDRKTIFDLDKILERCFDECKQMGYISNYLGDTKELIEGKQLPVPIIANQGELIHHIALTIVGELYELELVRRIAPLFIENRALTVDFQQFGTNFQYLYDKTIQDYQNRTLRIHPQGREAI